MSADLLRRMLRDAYESGWYGVRELADEEADAIMKKHESLYQKSDPAGFVNVTSVYGLSSPVASSGTVSGGSGGFNQWTLSEPAVVSFTTAQSMSLMMQDQSVAGSSSVSETELTPAAHPHSGLWLNVGDG